MKKCFSLVFLVISEKIDEISALELLDLHTSLFSRVFNARF